MQTRQGWGREGSLHQREWENLSNEGQAEGRGAAGAVEARHPPTNPSRICPPVQRQRSTLFRVE